MDGTFTKADWDRYAECYDALNELRPYAEMLDDILEILCDAEYPLLDAGCGTGNLTVRLCGQRKSVKTVVGIDMSDAMLERARKKCSAAGFLRTDIDSVLPFGDRMFGTIACSNALYALKGPVEVLREFFRVLRPEGLLIIATPKQGYENGFILKSHCQSAKPDAYWLNAHENTAREERLVREAIPNEELARRFLCIARFNRTISRERSFHFFTAEELLDLAYANGFTAVRIRETYAGQNLLLTATRRPESGLR